MAGVDQFAREAVAVDENQQLGYRLQTLMAKCNLSTDQWLEILATEDSNLFARLLISATDSLEHQKANIELIGPRLAPLVKSHPNAHVKTATLYLKNRLSIDVPMGSQTLGETYQEVDGIPFVRIPSLPIPGQKSTSNESSTGEANGFWVSAVEIPQAWVVKEFSGVPEMSDTVKGISWLGPQVAAHRVSVPAAMRVCNRLSVLARRTPYYLSINEQEPMQSVVDNNASGFRIPTTAEWQWMASAKATTSYFHGAESEAAEGARIDFNDYGWFRSSQETSRDCNFRPSGLKRPNAWGMFDVYGNVFEISLSESRQEYVGSGGFISFEGRRCASNKVDTIRTPYSYGLRPICPILDRKKSNERTSSDNR